MYQIKNLTKNYHSKKENNIAIKDISFSLPDTGMIFITGKSGSGKSTLLNQIGGLDKPTSGSIYFNNLNITKLNEKQLSKYRKDYVGFIFQDFALIESMTVFDNVSLALEIKQKDDSTRVLNTLDALGLLPYKDRLVTALSAGQKQRVAIARATVKNPKVILADEPTGNLDHESSEIVLNFLKKISLTSLVVIISHNRHDAFKYGDKIIHLNNGQIVSNIETRLNNRSFAKVNNTVYINDIRDLNNNEFYAINNEIHQFKIQNIRPISDLFYNVSSSQNLPIRDNVNLENSKLKSHNLHKLFRNLMKKNFKKSAFLSLISMILISLFSLCVMLINFDSSAIYKVEDTPTLLYMKGVKDESDEYDYTRLGKITEEDQETISENSSDYYYTRNRSFKYGKDTQDYYAYGDISSISSTFQYLYSGKEYGIAVLTKEQYKEIFSLDEIEFISEAQTYNNAGIYITDYQADAMVFHQGVEINDLIGQVTSTYNNKYYVNGIIKTNYKEKFSDIFSLADETHNYVTKKLDISKERMTEFLTYVHNYYAVSYTFEENFPTLFSNSDVCNYIRFQNLALRADDSAEYINVEDPYCTFWFGQFIADSLKRKLGDYEIHLPTVVARSTFGANFSDEELNNYLASHKFKMKFGNSNNDIYEADVTISFGNSSNHIYCGEKLAHELLNFTLYRTHVNLLDKNNVLTLLNKLEGSGFTSYSTSINEIKRIDETIQTYSDLFKFIALILLISSVCFMLYLNYDSVKKKNYDIGVLKAIGLPISDLYKVYLLNILYQFIFSLIFYFAFVFLFKYIANNILLNSLLKIFTSYTGTLDFSIFNYTITNTIIDLSIISLTSLIGIFIPIFKIKNIKPIDIIRCKY